jgi:cyclopropane-fatty-acyl-phospholipid synthase
MRRNIVPANIAEERTEQVSVLTQLAKWLVLGQLRKIRHGRLRLIDGDLDQSFGERSAAGPFDVTVRVHGPQFYSDVAFAGTVGAGEAYINGLWQCDDLTGLVRLFVVNREMMNDMDSGWSRVSAPLLKLAHGSTATTRAAAAATSPRITISEIDSSSCFSTKPWPTPAAFSSIRNRRSRGLAREVRCRLQQARARTRSAPARDRHRLGRPRDPCGAALRLPRDHDDDFARTIRLCARTDRARRPRRSDHAAARGLSGSAGEYDALVSIEMIEAVGHQYLDTYFRTCGNLLKPDGAMLLQAITICDQLYESQIRSVDFIKRFIFPGGDIPSVRP